MAEKNAFLVRGAKLRCNFGNLDTLVQLPVDHATMANGKPMLIEFDNKPMVNILPFGICSAPANPAVIASPSKTAPCVPVIPAPWLNPDLTTKIVNNLSMTVEEFAAAYPDEAKKLGDFLSTLPASDSRAIQEIVCKAPEPYRSIYLGNLDHYSIKDTAVGGVYRSGEKTINFNISTEATNARGPYATFFHESGHATDYAGQSSAQSDTYKNAGGQKLQDVLVRDVRANVIKKVKAEVSTYYPQPDPKTMNRAERDEINEAINSSTTKILNNIMAGNSAPTDLSADEMLIFTDVVDAYHKVHLLGPNNATASDVYGGATHNLLLWDGDSALKIPGNYGHRPGVNGDYWYNPDGTIKRPQNRELFADYFAFNMTGYQPNLQNIKDAFPGACKEMDDMIVSMDDPANKLYARAITMDSCLVCTNGGMIEPQDSGQ